MSRGLAAVLAVAGALCGPPPAHAQAYPDKPIRVIVNSAAGGLTDVVARLVTIDHLLAEQLQIDAGLKLIHVPYKGGAPALNDVIAGHVSVFFDTLTTSAKLVQEDKLRALGIVSAKRSPTLPNVPTFAELGHADISGSTWFAIITPAGTPREIVTKLNEEANKALSLPDIRERIASLGGTVEGGPPTVLADLMRSEVPKWSKLIRERGITAQ